jgi:hypothetical protein
MIPLHEYGYNSDGVRVWKRDVLAGQEYRYVCRTGGGGVPMRVYSRAMGGGSWASVEDYLSAGNALGYNWNWQYRHTGGELLMMGATGEPSGYYPTDSNGLAVGQTLPMACVCQVMAVPMVCLPIGFGSCTIEGFEVCFIYPLPECQPKFKIEGPCTPDEWKKCRELCKQKGLPLGGCAYVSVGGINFMVCLCVRECTPAEEEKCRNKCKEQGKPLYGCWVGVPVVVGGSLIPIPSDPQCICDPPRI